MAMKIQTPIITIKDLVKNYKDDGENGVRIDDEKRAVEEVNKQFSAISCQINKGLDALRKVEENERNVEEKIKFITNNIINN